MIIVQKYGGTSVADNIRLENVARIVEKTRERGNQVVVVVSAQGKTTDMLIDKAKVIDENIPSRELAMLISTGEQQSMSLLTMTLNKNGIPAISLTGGQAGIYTNSIYNYARITRIDPTRIMRELEAGKVVVVAGFQGIDNLGDITTLGRGGSDTTAVALAAALSSERCEIYSDVDGIYTADPRIVRKAKKLDKISYDMMLELASLGAKVLNNRSVELAKKYNVKLTSNTSFDEKEGTEITGESFESAYVAGFTADRDVCIVTIGGIEEQKDLYELIDMLAKNSIPIDILAQSIGLKDISFTIKSEYLSRVRGLLSEQILEGKTKILESYGKVSMVGAGMINKSEVVQKIYEALEENNISVNLIGSTETRFSVIVKAEDVDIALNSIHNKFIR